MMQSVEAVDIPMPLGVRKFGHPVATQQQDNLGSLADHTKDARRADCEHPGVHRSVKLTVVASRRSWRVCIAHHKIACRTERWSWTSCSHLAGVEVCRRSWSEGRGDRGSFAAHTTGAHAASHGGADGRRAQAARSPTALRSFDGATESRQLRKELLREATSASAPLAALRLLCQLTRHLTSGHGLTM